MALEALFNQIVDAIHEKDGTTGGIAAEDFPDRIRAIPSIGGDFSGWLELPEPQDDEMYLLMHIPEGGSELLAFTVGLAPGGTCSVELGTTRGGTFFPLKRIEMGDNSIYEAELFAADYGDITVDGFAQAVVKIGGKGIRSWGASNHSLGGARRNWRVVEIVCRLPSGRSVICGGSKAVFALDKLRRFSWTGEADAKLAYTSMFSNCLAIETISSLPPIDSSTLSYVFKNCTSLREAPALSGVTLSSSFAYAFQSCANLDTAPQLDLSSATNLAGLFLNCISLRDVGRLNIANATNCANMFNGCDNLERVLLGPDVVGWAGGDISLSGCCLGHTALVELLESLPAITANHKLTLTGNPGVSELTEEEKAVATGKNWTLVL